MPANILVPAGNYDMYKETVDPNYNIRRIVNDETTRLQLKGNMINLEYNTKQRKDIILASITARDAAYYNMIMVVSFIAIVVAGSVYLNQLMPSVAFDLIIMLVIGVGIIYLTLLYVDFIWRDKVDYNKIDPVFLKKTPVVGTVTSTLSGETVVAPDGFSWNITAASDTGCFGGCCCPIGTSIFVDNKCTKKESFVGTIEPFTINPTYNLI
jgi:hypothetical protein